MCLLTLNGLRISEACAADVTDPTAPATQPTLQILGKGNKPAQIPLNPRTQQVIGEAVENRTEGPLLPNEWHDRMQRHNAAAIITRLVRRVGITHRVTPHALRRPYITIRTAPGRPTPRDATCGPAQHRGHDGDYDQSDRSYLRDPTFVLMAATAR